MNVQEKKPEKKTEQAVQFIKENRVAVIGIAVAVILVIAIVIGVFAGKHAQQTSSDPSGELESQTETETTDGTETAEVPLEEDAYPQINALMEEYYQAATDGDVEKLRTLVDSIDEETLIYQEKRSAYIEAYQNLKCYTKAGPTEGSYVVYVYYEVKFAGVETLVPGVSPYLVYTREDGSCYIHEGEVDESVNLYLEDISAQDDVVDLMNRVQVQFNETVVEDEELNNFLAKMRDELKVEVGEALAEAEAAQTDEESQTSDGSVNANATEVRAIDVVNVRASDSEQAERIGKLQIGDVLPLIESKANGWSKVSYDGKEGYVKSEYLEFLGDESADAESESGQQGADAEDSGDGEQQSADAAGAGDGSSGSAGSTSLPSSGKIKVGDTINIRKSASQTADKLGVCYQGEELEIVMHQADGWTKVVYKGQTGYVKTDVLVVME